MNWTQLHTASTEEERLELLLHMLHTLEARQSPIILAGGRLRRERRSERVAHFIRDRRGRQLNRAIPRALYIFILGTVFFTLWLVALNIPPEFGAPLVFTYTVMLTAFLLMDPARVTLVLFTLATEQ